MNPLFGLLAPALALLPASGAVPDLADGYPPVLADGSAMLLPAPADGPPGEPESFADMARSLRVMAEALRVAQAANQVRIEQRIIMRIAPGPAIRPHDVRRSLFAGMDGPAAPRFLERKMNQCVPVSGIGGVRPDGPSRLVLFMRDQRIVSASLDKACNARDFYSGFLVERTGDGMICAGRDKLLSRSGANCELGKLRQLVQLDDDE